MIGEGSESPGIAEKVKFLSRPEVWPKGASAGAIEIKETHMSWVFLGRSRVLKLKKPARTGALDFSTLARREVAVAEELRLNRRLAPDVYLGARALRLRPDGQLSLGPDGEVADWLVEMRRLPEERTLAALIETGAAQPDDLVPFAEKLIAFYRSLTPADIAPHAYADRFVREHRETVRVLTDPALCLGERVPAELLGGFAECLERQRSLLEHRVRAGHIIEGHGDLRPEHVFLTDPPVIIDCLEFNQGLRMVDPFDEIVFLGLECARLGADWVLPVLHERLENGLDDRPEPALLAFYWRYRALLRARLALLHLREPIVRAPGKWRPLACHYLDLARQAELRFPLK